MAWRVSEKAPEMSACDAMMAAAVARPTSGSSAHARREQEERLLGCGRVQQQQRALAEVVQQQRRQHQREPRHSNRTLAEVSHVGVQGFAAGHDEEHGSEHRKPMESVLAEEGERMARVDRRQHDRLSHDPSHAKQRR